MTTDVDLKAKIKTLEFELAQARQSVPKVWIGVSESIRKAVLAERSSVVEWLRSRAAAEAAGNGFGEDFASWIESGSHCKR